MLKHCEVTWFDPNGGAGRSSVAPEYGWSRHGDLWRNEELALEFAIREKNGAILLPREKMAEHGRIRFSSIALEPEGFRDFEGGDTAFLLPCELGVLSRCRGKRPAEYLLPGFSAACWPPHYIMNLLTVGVQRSRQVRAISVEGAMFNAGFRLRTNYGTEHAYTLEVIFLLRRTPGEALPLSSPEIALWEVSGGVAAFADECRSRLQKRWQVPPLSARPELDEAARTLPVRLRMAAKPVPSPVEEQTPDNEPELRVFMNFEQAMLLADECRAQGIDKIDFTLVGWNRGGHDGAFPQLFPVEPKLGGEESMRRAVNHIQSLGYRIGFHDNYTDTYTLAENLNHADWMLDPAGKVINGDLWGGGRAHLCCPRRAYEHYLPENFRKLAKFHWNGACYVDVISLNHLRACCNPAHPLTLEEAAAYNKRILRAQHEFTGVSMSEGAREWALPELDRAYSVANAMDTSEKIPFADAPEPWVALVLHGLLLYNACRTAINSMPGETQYLYNIARGGLPLLYFYQRFRSNGDHSGTDDLRITTPENLKRDVARLKQVAGDITRLAPLQKLFLRTIETPQPQLECLTFENSIKLYVNYRDEAISIDGEQVPPRDFIIVQPRQESESAPGHN